MPELLLELFSEEIPARMQARAAEDLKRLVCEKLTEQGLTFTRADAYVTPRRLALVVDGLPEKQPDRTVEKKGPRVGAPEKAIEGFLKSAGLTSLDQCEKRNDGKGEVWFASAHIAGSETGKVAAELIASTVAAFPWAKSMRFAADRLVWVRPLHSVIALFGGKAVSGSIDRGETRLALGRETRGHRFLAPASFSVTSFEDYRTQLLGAKVILDPAERRASILDQAHRLAKEAGLVLVEDNALADEVTGLVEWPLVYVGTIDERFMSVPPEVLTTTMRANQKYFALHTKDGKLAPRFLVVSNMETKDDGKAIVAGNERVLRARLSDAEFFWNQDRKVRLEDRVPALEQIVFHAKLGTVAEKMRRVEFLAGNLIQPIANARRVTTDLDRLMVQARRAAQLAKADLTTGMVKEFPELQGVMGRYYALNDGEGDAVADAIAEHYAPLGPADRCPNAPVSVAVALADKLDTLVGFFLIDEKPTGSKDPFALRRAALGVIRLILESKLRISLRRELRIAADRYDQLATKTDVQAAIDGLMDFFADRVKVALRDKGVRHDLISAAFALGEDDLVRLLARVEALQEFLNSEDGANLLVAYRRAANIVAAEVKKGWGRSEEPLRHGLLFALEERELFTELEKWRGNAEQALTREDFANAMYSLANLRKPVDDFFNNVRVNDPNATEERDNRLKLLLQIRATLDRVADFSKIEG